MRVTGIERFILNIPLRNRRVERHMHRACTHGERPPYIWRVETNNGLVGFGEGAGDDGGVARTMGRNPFDLLNEDSIGQGLQIALLDLAGKAAGIPVYRLLGEKVRDECPFSWWAIDMPPEDWVEEVKLGLQLGYMSSKLKARPWFDIFQQMDAVSEAVPRGFTFSIDFNFFLRNAATAIPLLRELEQNEHIAIFEGPIPQEDVEGNSEIQRRTTKPISLHVGVPPLSTALKENVCDGFVMYGGCVNEVRGRSAILAMANKPFWLQMPGTGIMTAFTLHLGAILSHAQWPAVTCHETWADDLLKERLEVRNGYIRVPEEPGLGVEVDEDALHRFRVELGTVTPKDQYLEKRRVLKIRWPAVPGSRQGPARCFLSEPDYQRAFSNGNLPLFTRGVTLEVVEDDESPEFNRLHGHVKSGGHEGVWE